MIINNISFSFDDGESTPVLGKPFTYWNDKVLDALDEFDLRTMFFVSGKYMDNPVGASILQRWNDTGHYLANHTYTHLDYHTNIDAKIFCDDILKNELVLSEYSNFVKYFRPPFLHGGETQTRQKALDEFLSKNGYKLGYVTIDCSDWYFNDRFIEALKKSSNSMVCIDLYRELYLNHIINRAQFYAGLSSKVFDHKINHVLLLHHNLISAFFIRDLIVELKKRRWQLVDINDAYDDTIGDLNIKAPVENGLVWMGVRDIGLTASIRNPAESWVYEKNNIDSSERAIV